MKYDVLIVGAGLFGCTMAHSAYRRNMKALVVEKRDHIGGNCYTKTIDGIPVHMYGAHIFRTSDKRIWDFLGQFCEFNNFINCPIARFGDELYNLPFNMNTFHQLWGVITPNEAQQMIEQTRVPCEKPKNLEEHVLDMVGCDIYEKLVKGYTEKQWGKPCKDLPPSIMRRIPLRFTYDNNYFNDRFQGIPIGGYTPIFEKLLDGCDIALSTDYLSNKTYFDSISDRVIFTGPIDAFYDYRYGPLEYRSLRFELEKLDCENFQGNAVVNYTDSIVPYTRCIEHKHFEFLDSRNTVISYEYPQTWTIGKEPFYPLEDVANQEKYARYYELASNESKVRFGGRLGEYKYYDMQETIKSALSKADKWL